MGKWFIKKNQAAAVQELVEFEKEKDQAEYRRKLYVALTRAEDELYVTGVEKRGQEKSWYQMVYDGLAPHCREIKGDDEKTIAWRHPVDGEHQYKGRTDAPSVRDDVLPDWIANAAPEPPTRRIVEPSKHDETHGQASGGALDRETARLRGTALHALLQFMPRFDRAERDKLAAQALLTLMPNHAQLHQEMIAQAHSILDHQDFADLFGPNSRGEVAVAADIDFEDKPSRITGRIDRLLVKDDEVLIVDFKSDANPPTDIEQIPRNYRTQLMRYRAALRNQFPNRPINCAILWTENAQIFKIIDSDFQSDTKLFTSS